MPTIWNIGAIMNASMAVNVMNWPSVMACARIWRAPTYMISAPTTPISTVADRLITEVAVSDFSTLVEQPLHASGKDSLFLRFGMVSLHHTHAAQRFGETARDFGVDLARSRKMGRMMPKALRSTSANPTTMPSAITVSSQLR